ncbi:MAG: cytochrome P450 [Gemmatimonadota bacterium]
MAWPFARLAVEPGVRRRFRAFPRMQAILTGSIAVYAVVVAGIALAAPAWLRPAAAIAAVALATERWQARPGYGKSRGWPPGSLAMAPLSAWRDPTYYARQAARHGPVFKFRHFVYPAAGIVGLERAADFLRTQAGNLFVPPAPFNSLVPGGFVRYLEAGHHHDVAAVLRAAMSPNVVEACQPALAEEARIAVERLAVGTGGGVDPLPVVDRMVLHDMMHAFYGISRGPLLERLEAQYRIADYRRLTRVGRARACAAIFEIVRQVRELAPGSADGSGRERASFLSELARLHPELLTDDEVMGNFVYTLQTARLDVNGLLMWLLKQAAEHPAWMARLAEEAMRDPAAVRRPDGLADRMVRETLRLDQSEFLLRRAKRPIRWGGFDIPAGWFVRVCVQESHRSHEAFDDPERFDPDRFLRPLDRTRYSPFGVYRRLCPGEHLSRAIATHLVVELASGYDLEVRGDGPPEFSGFHWRPSPRFRVRLVARSSGDEAMDRAAPRSATQA